jgi:hypothetical protein
VASWVPALPASASARLLTQELLYQAAGAAEVELVWGINGWQRVPEADRPAGTVVKDAVMHTPMAFVGDRFVAKVHIPAGADLDFGFLVTKLRSGGSVGMWDGDYRQKGMRDHWLDVRSKLSLTKSDPITSPAPAPQVTQAIRYEIPWAAEVVLVWGIEGWQPVPEHMRPPGTVIKNDVMHTPMAKSDRVFAAAIQAPIGSTIHYGFLVTKARNGATVNAWEASKPFRIADTTEAVEITSSVTLEGQKSRNGLENTVYILIVAFIAVNAFFLAVWKRRGTLASARSVRFAVVGLTLQGLLLRLVAAHDAHALLVSPGQLFGDEPGYDYLAVRLLDGHFFDWPARTPVYPLFLTACYWMFGHSFGAVLYAQAAVGASVIPLTFLLARRFTRPGWALLAAGLVAVHPALIGHVTRLYTEALYTPFQLLAVLSFLRALDTPTVARFATGGMLLAVTTLCRPTIALFPLIVPFLLPRGLSLLRRASLWVCYTGAMIIVIAPWSYHNYRTYHMFLPLSVTSGVVLWHGSPEHYHLTMEDQRHALQIWDGVLNPRGNGGHDPMSIDGDRYFLHRAIASIRQEPGVYLWYALQKSLFFWIGHPAIDWPGYSIFGFDAMRPYFSAPHIIGVFVVRLLPFLALISLVVLRDRLKDLIPLLALCAYFMVIQGLTQAEVRYSEPLFPILATMITMAACRVWAMCREHFQHVAMAAEQSA